MATVQSQPSPDAIAKKLFIMTMCGAVAFLTLIMVMTHLLSAEGRSEAETSTPPLVRLVPLE